MAATALITGASGLVGSWTLHHWVVPGLEPTVVRSRDVDLLEDGSAARLVATTRPAVVVHLAWSASGAPDYRTSTDNERWLDATMQLVEACAEHDARLWLTGTAVDDDHDAADAYTRAKVALRCHLSREIEDEVVGWLRPFYVFDEERGRPALVAHALRARSDERAAELQSPDNRHDFVHASDVGRAVVTAVSHRLMGVVPIGSGRTRRVADLVGALGVRWTRSLGSPPDVGHEDVAADTSRLRAAGWKPSRTEEFFGHD
jgi:nucleoside-diphosphate-sugar epimerase